MNATAVPAPAGSDGVRPTANDRLKRSFQSCFWASTTVATLAHIALFALWPEMTAADVSFDAPDIAVIELPPDVDIPEAPEEISKPATPIMATAELSEDITIGVTTFGANPVTDLPPPPDQVTTTDITKGPQFTPYTVKPDVKNRQVVGRALQREYPTLLRDAGIGGTVNVWFFINEEGAVVETQIDQSSGHTALDEAALRVADVFEFTPALNRDKRVPVWVSIAITFETK